MLSQASNVFEPFAVPNQVQSLTPNDKGKHSVAGTYNAYTHEKKISGKVSKISGLSLSDMGEYNDAEKEKILALLEDQQYDQYSNTQKIKEILRQHKSDVYTDQSDNQYNKFRGFASDISQSNAGHLPNNDVSPNFDRAEDTNSLEDVESAGADASQPAQPGNSQATTKPEAPSPLISNQFAPVD